MRSLLRPGDRPWRINAIIIFLFLFFLWAKFFMPTEAAVVQTLSLQAVVVSVPEPVKNQKKISSNTLVKVRLPDGMHAYVSWQAELPDPGDQVGVRVEVHEDGRRRVKLNCR